MFIMIIMNALLTEYLELKPKELGLKYSFFKYLKIINIKTILIYQLMSYTE